MTEEKKEEVLPENLLTPSEEEVYQIGKDLRKILSTVGFRRYLDWKRKKRLEIGNRSLHDTQHSRDYWLGYEQGATDDEEALNVFLDMHREIAEKIKAVEDEQDLVRGATIRSLGGGELA